MVTALGRRKSFVRKLTDLKPADQGIAKMRRPLIIRDGIYTARPHYICAALQPNYSVHFGTYIASVHKHSINALYREHDLVTYTLIIYRSLHATMVSVWHIYSDVL